MNSGQMGVSELVRVQIVSAGSVVDRSVGTEGGKIHPVLEFCSHQLMPVWAIIPIAIHPWWRIWIFISHPFNLLLIMTSAIEIP